MAVPVATEADRRARRRRPTLSRADNPLVRAVARVPATVLAKLLVTFVGTVVLLVILGVLGLWVLGESNARVEALGHLQQRAAAYGQLQTTAEQVQALLTLRNPGYDNCVYSGTCPTETPSGASLARIDDVVAATLTQLRLATDPSALGFTPPPDEHAVLVEIDSDRAHLSDAFARIAALDAADRPAEGLRLQQSDAIPPAEHLRQLAISLARTTQQATDDLIASNQQQFGASQALFVAVAVISIVLALLLGYVLSWSIVGPIRKMETRLAAISSGDFGGHVTVPNRDELGSLATNLNQMNDELQRLYAELEAASRHKSEFLANMSHELRTPLNAIIGFSQVLRQEMFGDLNDKQREYLDDILGSSQHLLGLINDILDLSKVEAGRMDLQVTVFPLVGPLEGSLSMVRERALKHDIQLATTIDPSVDLIEADERKVKQILFNLLSNAVKFTPDGGRVSLTARATEGTATIAVADTGVGISAEDQARIFEEFVQVGRVGAQEGTGLGLALTRRLVELHGGRLSVVSVPGEGSTFTVSLPLRQVPAAAEEPLS